jgi:hypothetical protein
MLKTGYRSYYKEKYNAGTTNPQVNGGISASPYLSACVEQTLRYLGLGGQKVPFIVYSYETNTVVYDSENLKGETKMVTEKTLYEIKRGDETLFGHKLAINSQGQWVMEVKGSGDVVAVDKATVSEVIPYTIGIKFHGKGDTYSYFDEKRSVTKGDVLVVDSVVKAEFCLAVVSDVDTKSKTATKEISYLKNLGGA